MSWKCSNCGMSGEDGHFHSCERTITPDARGPWIAHAALEIYLAQNRPGSAYAAEDALADATELWDGAHKPPAPP